MKAQKISVRPIEISADDDALEQIAHGLSNDPFAWLGPHESGQEWLARIVAPGAQGVELTSPTGALLAKAEATAHEGLYIARLKAEPDDYRWRIEWPEWTEIGADAYAFGPLLAETDLEAFRDGHLRHPAEVFGAHPLTFGDISGVCFALWAPTATRVSVVGDFNRWDGRRHPMRLRHTAGVWEIFIPGVGVGDRYKFELLDASRILLPLRADPFARRSELPPATASVVMADEPFLWHDTHWLARRAAHVVDDVPVSIYEVHAPSWQRGEDGQPLDWDGLAGTLIPYVQAQGFTHIELLPVSEHPFGGSWGYQPVGLYAPTARMGSPEALARFVDSCHVAGVGVIFDWVCAHFPDDPHGLRLFDGTALYEHADPREGFHQDWHTSIYNFGRSEVRNYLIGSALEWVERFHIDGLRVDAVASMLYRDYSRAAGEWIPNAHGGRENLEAVAFVRELNEVLAHNTAGVMVIAEESTAWQGVSAPVAQGGLGFSHKWNMGWMHDTLNYMQRDPIHRKHHQGELTFGLAYAWSERFILPLSHDEVVHGKGSLLSRMPGDPWQRFASLRAYFGFMWAHPGKKLLFMGGEFAQWREWDHDRPLDWFLLDDPAHRGVQQLMADLNRLLHEEAALHRDDHHPRGFAWVACDAEHSVYAFMRYAADACPILAVCNFTPEPRRNYRVGVPHGGDWREVCNTDSAYYGGSNLGNGGLLAAEPVESHGHACSLRLTLPPLATLLLRPDCV
jgi:1,4-alpha-glucan branching enzyme